MRPAGTPTSTLPARTPLTLLIILAFAHLCLMACQKSPSSGVVIALMPVYSVDLSSIPSNAPRFDLIYTNLSLHRAVLIAACWQARRLRLWCGCNYGT